MTVRTISVFGLGHVGLVTAVCIAKRGYNVVGVDPNARLLGLILRGESPFHEPLLSEYLEEVIQKGLLRVSSDPATNSASQLTYITVGTPSRKDGSLDLGFIKSAARSIAKSLPNDGSSQLVVIKSTVTPGTARSVVKPILQRSSSKRVHFRLCSNPEFLREGKAIRDTEFPDRIIIGSDDPEAVEELATFYMEFYSNNIPPLIRTSHENAELIKCANNAFLATKISFINSIGNIAERVPGADVRTIADGIGLDSRIGREHLNAGLGWGGYCFQKDVPALIQFSKKIHIDPELFIAAWRRNDKQWGVAIQTAERALGRLSKKNIAVLGLAFKPDTDDMRGAVSVPLIRGLIRRNASVRVYDPSAIDNAKGLFGELVQYATTSLECLAHADCCIVVTEWDEFKAITPKTFREHMRRPIVIDGRRIYDPKEFLGAGIKFYAIGLGPI
jgi:UDPglucose 6-dehydrogenase